MSWVGGPTAHTQCWVGVRQGPSCGPRPWSQPSGEPEPVGGECSRSFCPPNPRSGGAGRPGRSCSWRWRFPSPQVGDGDRGLVAQALAAWAPCRWASLAAWHSWVFNSSCCLSPCLEARPPEKAPGGTAQKPGGSPFAGPPGVFDAQHCLHRAASDAWPGVWVSALVRDDVSPCGDRPVSWDSIGLRLCNLGAAVRPGA